MSKNCTTTKWALIISSILNEPLIFLYALLLPILYHELHASTFQLTLLTTLHPIVSVFSVYWSSWGSSSPKKMKRFIVLGGVISKLVWFLIPFTTNSWLIIGMAALYVLFSKGTTPLWSEILRQKLEKKQRHRLFSVASTAAYAVALLLTVTLGRWMSINSSLWQSAFFISGLIGLIGIAFQAKIPVDDIEIKKDKFSLTTPWKEIFHVLKEDEPFLKFQLRFMVFGIAAMMMHPIMNIYFIFLKLDYMQIGLLISLCKGVGSVATTNYWGKLLNRIGMSAFSSMMFILFGSMIVLAGCASFHLGFLYLAYLVRGAAQGGIHMIWNLSGPYFADQKNSAAYSGINLMMVGARGLFAPAIGLHISLFFGVLPALAISGSLCFLSATIFRKSINYAFQENQNMA